MLDSLVQSNTSRLSNTLNEIVLDSDELFSIYKVFY